MVALLLVALGLPVAAQPFNLRCEPYGQMHGEVAFSVEALNNGGFVVIAGAPYFNGTWYYSSVVTAIVVDPQGVVLGVDGALDTLRSTYAGWSNSSDKRNEGGEVVGGGGFRSDSLGNWIQRAVLYFFDGNGQFEQMAAVSPENQEWIGRQAKQTPDGGYVICGRRVRWATRCRPS